MCYKFIFFKFLLTSRYFYNEGPIDDFIKFLLKSNDYICIALCKMYYAPWVFIKFYDIFSYFNILFLFNGIDIIYAPLIPISLSYNLSTYNVLFCNNTAAIHLAPSMPNEFFLIDPSIMPKSKTFKWLFLISYSSTRDSPT